MSVTFSRESDDFAVIRIQGILTFDDLKEIENRGRKAERSRMAKTLVIAEQFTGWGKEGDWGDLTFKYEHDSFIEKIAVVAAEKWRDQFLMFLGEGRRKALVRFYCLDEQEYAKDWLKNKNE